MKKLIQRLSDIFIPFQEEKVKQEKAERQARKLAKQKVTEEVNKLMAQENTTAVAVKLEKLSVPPDRDAASDDSSKVGVVNDAIATLSIIQPGDASEGSNDPIPKEFAPVVVAKHSADDIVPMDVDSETSTKEYAEIPTIKMADGAASDCAGYVQEECAVASLNSNEEVTWKNGVRFAIWSGTDGKATEVANDSVDANDDDVVEMIPRPPDGSNASKATGNASNVHRLGEHSAETPEPDSPAKLVQESTHAVHSGACNTEAGDANNNSDNDFEDI